METANTIAAKKGLLSREQLQQLLQSSADALIITTRIIPATDTKGARVSARFLGGRAHLLGGKRCILISYRYELTVKQNHLSVALQLLSATEEITEASAPIAAASVLGGWDFVFQA